MRQQLLNDPRKKAFACWALALMLVVPSFSSAKVYYSKNEAMELAFGAGSNVSMQSLFPDTEQQARIETLARTRLESRLFTFYVGKQGDRILGYAAIETHTVRTKPETLLVVLNAEGALTAVHTLAFHEPPEYQPPERWYQTLYRLLLPQLSFGTEVQGISGATLSTRSALSSVRKVLAMYQVMLGHNDDTQVVSR